MHKFLLQILICLSIANSSNAEGKFISKNLKLDDFLSKKGENGICKYYSATTIIQNEIDSFICKIMQRKISLDFEFGLGNFHKKMAYPVKNNFLNYEALKINYRAHKRFAIECGIERTKIHYDVYYNPTLIRKYFLELYSLNTMILYRTNLNKLFGEIGTGISLDHLFSNNLGYSGANILSLKFEAGINYSVSKKIALKFSALKSSSKNSLDRKVSMQGFAGGIDTHYYSQKIEYYALLLSLKYLFN